MAKPYIQKWSGQGGQNDLTKSAACWRTMVHRGMPERATVCPTDMKLSSSYCYAECAAGYDSENGACFASCPKGTELGVHSCLRPASVERFASNIKCEGCHQEGLHWFKKSCPAGYTVDYTGHCIAPCPEGTSDAGHMGCLRKYKARTYSRAGCPEGSHSQGFMCWKSCPKGQHAGVGPLCWDECPAGTHPCMYGTLCVNSDVSCAQFTHDFEKQIGGAIHGLDFKHQMASEIHVGSLIGNSDFPSCSATL